MREGEADNKRRRAYSFLSLVTYHPSRLLEEIMKRTLIFLSLALVALSGCKFGNVRGSGTMRLERRDVPAFTAVDVSGAYDVEIVAQKEQSLEVEGDDNLLPLIKTEVRDGVLRIYNEKGFNTRQKLHVRITLKDLDGINASGASDIVATNVKTDEFNVEASGAGSLQISGETKTLDVGMSGAGELKARNLHAESVQIKLSGAAHADVYATQSLDASVSGAGNIDYYGDPKNIKEDRSGAGEISKK
jgi:hypothetical protein